MRPLSVEQFKRVLAGGALPSDGPPATRLAFTVKGRARGLARARKGGDHWYDPQENEDSKEEIARAFKEAARGLAVPLDAPVTLTVIASYQTPRKKLWGQGKTTRSDLDNCCKTVLDALDGLAYRDDALVVELHAWKKWGDESSFTVSLVWGVPMV